MNVHSIHICDCISRYGMRLVQTADKCYWPHFVFSCIFCVIFMSVSRVFAAQISAVAQTAQNLEGAKILYFRLTTVFCLEYRLSEHKMTRYSKNLKRPCPPGLPLIRLWTSVCFANNSFFDNQQVAFVRLDKFENILWIVVMAASALETFQ